MYYEHPFKIDGVYYAKIDGAMIEITEELAKAMLSKEERYLIDAVYYRKVPQIVLARKYGITPPAINKKVKCILFKIRSLYGTVEF